MVGIELDRDGPEPLYRQIAAWMRDEIATGAWKESAKIPSEQELSEGLGVNRGTLRRAIEILVRDGLLERVHGRGTFVAATRIAQDLADSFITFSESLLERNIPYRTRVLRADVAPASARTAARLGVAEGDALFVLERVRYVDDDAVVFLRNHVVHRLCAGIESVDFESERLFDAIEQRFGHPISHGQRLFEAVTASPEIAGHLGAERGAAAMYVQQLSLLADDTPIELSDLWFRGDKFRLSARVTRMRIASGLREILVET